MKLKLVEIDGKQYAELQDGKPVYVHDDGKEIPFDAVGTVQSLNSRIEQSKRVEAENKTLKEKVSAFEGLDDPVAAKKALEVVKNLDDKKLIDAGEVERVKTEIAKSYETKLADVSGKLQQYEQQLYAEKIGGSFARSKIVAEKLAIPADLVQARFGQQFKIEEGKIVAYDGSGNKIYSRSRPGELADFDEALDSIVEAYPYKEHILKAPSGNGGGAPGNTGGSGTKNFDASKLGGDRTERLAALKARFPGLE